MIMLNEKKQAIIRILREADDYVTSKELADKLDISVRTIKTAIKGLNGNRGLWCAFGNQARSWVSFAHCE